MSYEKIINSPFLKVADSSPLPILWVLPSGCIFHLNEAACEHFGYTVPEMLALKISDLDPEFSEEAVKNQFSKIRQDQLARFETVNRRKDGSRINVEVVAHYIKTEEIEFALCYVFDLTERQKKDMELEKKTAELEELNISLEQMVCERTKDLEEKLQELEKTQERLRMSEMKFINAFKTSQDAININSMDGIYLEINDGFTQIMGYTPEEAVGKSSLELNVWKIPKDRERLVAGLRRDGIVHNLASEFQHKDGSTVYGLMSASIQTMNGESVILSVSKDITKIKMLENELKDLNMNLLEKIKTEVEIRQKQESMLFEQRKFADMGLMINAIAHQWRQPLNALGLLVQDVLEAYRFDGLDENYISHFEGNAFRLITFMSETIDQFRNFFRTSKDKEEFSVAASINEVFSLIDAQLTMNSIDFSMSCEKNGTAHKYPDMLAADGCGIMLDGYKGEFKQAMLNLMYNAVDAIENRKKSHNGLKGKISVSIHPNCKNMAVKVADNGGGIPTAYMDNIFDPFFTTKDMDKGTGIGLYMTRLIIEKHYNGTVKASNSDEGAVFTITIPIR